MRSKLAIAGIDVQIDRKAVKNTHLSVYPPNGRVQLTAPLRESEEALRFLVIKELSWIRKQRARLQGQTREPARECIERESHMLWGRRYLLHLTTARRPSVAVTGRALKLDAPASWTSSERGRFLQEWYRARLRERAEPLVKKWSARLHAPVRRFYVQSMRTKWGSSNPASRTIRLNLELAKLAPVCLDYVVLHEVAHFKAPNHGDRFVRILDECMPEWRAIRARLNRYPLPEF